MNKTTILIVGFIGIFLFYYVFVGKKIAEGLQMPDKNGEDKNKDAPKIVDSDDPNAALVTTCTNLVQSHVNKCSADAAGLMSKAFGPNLEDESKKQYHAVDSKILTFLKKLDGKLKGLSNKKKITDKAIKLAPKFAPKFEYPKRRALSPDEYNMWRNVLAQSEEETNKDAANKQRARDIKIYVSDNRVVQSEQENGEQGNGGQGNDGQGNGGGGNNGQQLLQGDLENGNNTGPLKGSFVKGGQKLDAYNHDDYI